MGSAADVTVLTGFLGSGKTTLLQRILSFDDDLSGTLVVVNEFGSIGVDGSLIKKTASSDMVELTSGCICCTLKIDLIQTMADLSRRFSPERVLIEATGVADPEAIISAFDDPMIRDHYRVTRTLTVVDADFWEAREAFGEVFNNQLSFADLILLNKIDLMETRDIPRVLEEVMTASGNARVLPTVHCAVDHEVVFGPAPARPETATGLDILQPYQPARDVTAAYVSSPDKGSTESANAGYVSFDFTTPGLMDRKCVEQFLRDLPLNVFRAKGPVRFPDGSMMLNYVGGQSEWIPWHEQEDTRLVFIGWDVETDVFRNKLSHCITE